MLGEEVVGDVVPIPPGTKLYTSNLVYATPANSKLPVGIYKVKRNNGEESVLVVNENGAPKHARLKPGDQVQPFNKINPVQGTGDNAPYSPLQIFSSEVMRALKTRLPHIGNSQLKRIIVNKWTNMSVFEKQVYKHKADNLKGVQGETAPITPSINPTIAVVKAHLPPGWKRTLARCKDGATGQGKLMIILNTPTGEKLRTKNELLEYTRINNIKGIGMDVFDFKRAPDTSMAPLTGLTIPPKSLPVPGSGNIPVAKFPPNSSVPQPNKGSISIRSVIPASGGKNILGSVINTSNGMKMVRMMVETSSGEQRETLVPAVPGANGTLKIALPK